MRADRLLSILLILQTGGRLTARELAERLEVSERTIHRDMEALSTSGVPVLAERGSGGGWSLLDDYRTNLTGLNPAEIQALFLAQPARLLADLGMRGAGEGALVKLLASLPDVHQRDAAFMRERIHVDGAGWRQTQERVACLPTIQDSIWRERKLHILYERGDDVCVDRVVDPLGLVAKSGQWYLVAAVEGEFRTYRASRVREAQVTDQACVRPAGFDLAAYWEQSTAEFKANLPRYPTKLRIHASILTFFQGMLRFGRVERTEPPDADGYQLVSVAFDVEVEAMLYASGFGDQVQVVEPEELREKVIEAGRKLLDQYGRSEKTEQRDTENTEKKQLR